MWRAPGAGREICGRLRREPGRRTCAASAVSDGGAPGCCGIGGAVRFYRTIFLEEINKDYIRTARAKGLSEAKVLFKHGLRNAMIPILTNVVVAIPLLFMGSMVMENFFAIPGLGSFTIDAIYAQDFAIVRCMVYLSSVLFILGLLLTDISYTVVDPRIRLE